MRLIDVGSSVEDATWMFRIEQADTTSGMILYCHAYKVLSKTPKGRWIVPSWATGDMHKKFVLDASRKKYAHLTKKEALESFIYRRKKQILILSRKLQQAQSAYNTALSIMDTTV